jgi:hypothetical protein
VLLTVTPFAIQPGQVLSPERCAVALRVDGPSGSWVGVWRPADRQVRHLAAPRGWLTGAGLWTPEAELQLPYSTPGMPCGVVRLPVEDWESAVTTDRSARDGTTGIRTESYDTDGQGHAFGTEFATGAGPETTPSDLAAGPAQPSAPRPVPLQQAPLDGLVTK